MKDIRSSDNNFPAENGAEERKIPPKIPANLVAAGFRFLKVRPVSKRAHEVGWTTEKNYAADDSALQLWLRHDHSFETGGFHYEGFGNYALLCTESLIVIDLDTSVLIKLADDAIAQGIIPATFSSQSGSGYGKHLVYRTSGAYTIPFEDPETKENVGHVKAKGGYALGPGSIHDKTRRPYIVLEDIDVAYVDFSEIIALFSKYILKKEKPLPPRVDKAKYEKFSIDIPIASICYPDKPQDKGGGEIQGAHPIHGSSGGMNFSINTVKNTWHCYRCQSGGGPLEWLAVENDLIRCDEAHKGCLRGDTFLKVLEEARGLGYEIEMPKRKAVEKPKILDNEPILLDALPEEIPNAHITLIDAFPRLGKTHWTVVQAIKHRTANFITNTHSICEQQVRIFREQRRIGQTAVHLEGKRRSCVETKKPCQCKQCALYPYQNSEDGDYMRFDAEARDVLFEKEVLCNSDVPEGMCPYWTIKAAEKSAHFCFTVSANLDMIDKGRHLTIIDEDPTVAHFYPSSADLAESTVSPHSTSSECALVSKWVGIEDWKKYLSGNKHPKGKKTVIRIINILEQIKDVLTSSQDEATNTFNKTEVLKKLNQIDTFIPEPEDISRIELIDKIKKFEIPDTLSVYAEALLFPYKKKQFAWQGSKPSTLRLIANEETRIREAPEGKMVIIGSTRAEMFVKSLGEQCTTIRVKTFPFASSFLFISVKPGEKEVYTWALEKLLREASKVNETFRYPSLVLVGTEKAQGRLVKVLGGIAKGSREENRIGQQWNRKGGLMNVFYQNSVISRGIDVEFYTRMFVHSTSFANPYWQAVADVAEEEGDEVLSIKAYGILDAITMDETTNSVLRISPVRRNPTTTTTTETFEDGIPKVVIINGEELWKVKSGVLEAVHMVETTTDILRDNLIDILDQTGSLPLVGNDLVTVNLPGVTNTTPAKDKAMMIANLLKTAPYNTEWKRDYAQPVLDSVERAVTKEIGDKAARKRKAYTDSLVTILGRNNSSHTAFLVQHVIQDMIRSGKLREYRSGKLTWLEPRPPCNDKPEVDAFWDFEVHAK